MKFAIVDDASSLVATMAMLMRSVGHQVLAIAFASEDTVKWLDRKKEIDFTTRDVSLAAQKIASFDPDLLFLDHNLEWQGVTGQHVMREAKIPTKKCVGISSTYPQKYCAQNARSYIAIKDLDVAIWEDREHPKFLTWLKTLR